MESDLKLPRLKQLDLLEGCSGVLGMEIETTVVRLAAVCRMGQKCRKSVYQGQESRNIHVLNISPPRAQLGHLRGFREDACKELERNKHYTKPAKFPRDKSSQEKSPGGT
jgi:hypothetical protein